MTWPSRRQWLAAVLTAVAAGAAALYLTEPQAPSTAASPTNRDPLTTAEIRTILEPDAIRAVDHPMFVAADKAGMRPNLSVIGVELGGQARAYPIAYLSRVGTN